MLKHNSKVGGHWPTCRNLHPIRGNIPFEYFEYLVLFFHKMRPINNLRRFTPDQDTAPFWPPVACSPGVGRPAIHPGIAVTTSGLACGLPTPQAGRLWGQPRMTVPLLLAQHKQKRICWIPKSGAVTYSARCPINGSLPLSHDHPSYTAADCGSS